MRHRAIITDDYSRVRSYHISLESLFLRIRPRFASNAIVRSKYAERGPVIQARVSQKAYRDGLDTSTQRASLAFPHAERDVLSGVTRDRDVSAFISGPAACVGGVPLMRARNP